MAKIPEPEIDGQTITFSIFTGSRNICVLRSGEIINIVSIPSGDTEIASDTILDVFSADGELLTSKQITVHLSFKCSDGQDRFYAVDFSQYPKVARYSLSFDE